MVDENEEMAYHDIVVKILIWIGHEREEFKNDGRGEGWMKIDFFYYCCTYK